MIRKFVTILFCLSMIACNASDSSIDKTSKLLPPNKGDIYFSAFPDLCGWEDCVETARIEAFDKLALKPIAWVYFSQNWGSDMSYPQQAFSIIRKTGKVPFVRFMPRNLNADNQDKTFSLQKIIDGDFDQALAAWALAAKRDGKPILVDFAVEANGNWFAFSGATNGAGVSSEYKDINYPDGPERWRDAYRHIIDIFRAKQVRNVTWFFHVNIPSDPNEAWNDPAMYYPGDDYIDWVGVSIYGPQTPAQNYWETFREAIDDNSTKILAISNKKPFALLEFGVTDHHPLGLKSDWLKDAFTTIKEQHGIAFSAISYWHENFEEEDNIWATLRIDSSPESLQTFRNEIADEHFVSDLIFENN